MPHPAMILLVRLRSSLPRDEVLRIMRERMPEFQAMEPEHQAWKQQVLAGDIELEEIDTSPYKDRYSKNSVQLDTIRKASAAD